jgi:hypothetical protein
MKYITRAKREREKNDKEKEEKESMLAYKRYLDMKMFRYNGMKGVSFG